MAETRNMYRLLTGTLAGRYSVQSSGFELCEYAANILEEPNAFEMS
jgi:hypothetical protein